MVLLVVAFLAVPLMVKEPVEPALTTKELIVQSKSASLPALTSSAKEIATAVSSLVILTEVLNELSVGGELTTGTVSDELVSTYPLIPTPAGMVVGTV